MRILNQQTRRLMRLALSVAAVGMAFPEPAWSQPTITQQPSNVTLRVPPDPQFLANRSATFRVGATAFNPPLTFHWQFNGTNLPTDSLYFLGVTTSNLVVTNVLIEHGGLYSCAVTDSMGTVISSNALLWAVVGPVFILHPQSQTIVEGEPVTFTVGLSNVCTGPFNYVWRYEARPIASNVMVASYFNSITLTNVLLSQSSNSTNAHWWRCDVQSPATVGQGVGSARAYVTVLPALSNAVDAPNFVWTTGGDAEWQGQRAITSDSIDAAQSGAIAHNQESWLQTTISGPGSLVFYWRVSSATNSDWLSFEIDGVVQEQVSGEVGWQFRNFDLAPGEHTVRWRYTKNGSSVSGLDSAWVDQVSFYFPQAPEIVSQPLDQAVPLGSTVNLNVTANGRSPLGYQWRKDGVNIPGANASTYTIVGVQSNHFGGYSVTVSNGFGAVTSRVATLNLIIVPAIVQPPLSQSVVAGGSVTFSLEITGNPPPFDYEWRRLTAPRFTNRFVLNERTSYFTIDNVQTNHVGNYAVVVRNAALPNGVNSIFTLTLLADSDGDGLPDTWESAYPTAADASSDIDNDGATNIEEYQAGTDPTNALSVLRIDRVTAGDLATLEFPAVSNRTYTVQCREAVDLGTWSNATSFVARSTNWTATATNTMPLGNDPRFYRLVTPRQP